MNKFLKILLFIVLWGAILGYLIFASLRLREHVPQVPLREISVRVLDYTPEGSLTPELVNKWLDQAGVHIGAMNISEIDTELLARQLKTHGLIDSLRIFTDMDGGMTLEVTQRVPVLRIIRDDSTDIYLTQRMETMQAGPDNARYVPVVTGISDMFTDPGIFSAPLQGSDVALRGEKKHDKNYLFITNLINFVRIVTADPFWNSQIVQIDVVQYPGSDWKQPELQLVPRAGNHIVVFGDPHDPTERLDKLRLFYDRVLRYEGWDKYRKINVKYRDQVVCTN